MSEFVDLVLDGVICSACGQFLGDATGYPRSCGWCETHGIPEDTGLSEAEPHTPESASVPEELEDDLPFGDDDDLPF